MSPERVSEPDSEQCDEDHRRMCDEGRDCGTSDSLTLLFEEKGNVDGMGVLDADG